MNDDQGDKEDIDDEQVREQKRLKKALDERVAAAGPASSSSSSSSSRCEDCRDTEGTSNPVERLLSYTKRVMSDCRKHMGPESLSAVACLTVNKVFWAQGELMAGQATQETTSVEESRKAALASALRAQEAQRLRMQEADAEVEAPTDRLLRL